MKLAVLKSGGKQYRVAENDLLEIEKIAGKAGDKVKFDQVLLSGDDQGEVKVGQPLLKGAAVTASITKQGREDKITVIKYKRKIRYHRKHGHRQPFTQVKIEKIEA